MEELRRTIIKIQNKYTNHEGRSFINDQDLQEVLRFDTIYAALHDDNVEQNCKVEPYHVDEIVNIVSASARKTFAILVCIRYVKVISYFLANDKCGAPELDHMLPLDKSSLQAIFDDQIFVNEFWERQWHYIAPVLSETVLLRSFPKETIMPFFHNDFLASGGFGDVYSIDIEPSHRRFGQDVAQDSKFVRKEMKSTNGNQAVFETELRNLSILKLLSHPNVVGLTSAYIYRKRMNMVFPRAHGGTLGQMLQGPRLPAFESNLTFLSALAGLCSGVRYVHSFTSSSHKLEMIGCHHDLKPDNVLVEGHKFILADFGLARFKDPAQLSDTPSRIVHAFYAAPECEYTSGRNERPIVHRSSDIWSLGCILAEAVTYMLGGHQSVDEFADKRAYKDEGDILNRFHWKGQSHPVVRAWLHSLRSSAAETSRRLGHLLEDMLRIQHKERPDAQETDLRMRCIAFAAMCEPIGQLFDRVCNEGVSIQAGLERARFNSWRYACNILDFDHEQHATQWSKTSDIGLVERTLMRLPGELENVLAKGRSSKAPIFQSLGQLNDVLVDDLPLDGQNRADYYVTTHMMRDASEELAAAPLDEDPIDNTQLMRLKLLATVKSMNQILKERPSNEWRLDRKRLENRKRVGDFKVQILTSSGAEEHVQVLVESKTYKEYHSDQTTATELQVRLEEITSILRRSHAADQFRVLPCAGYYQDPSTFSFGLVYRYPHYVGAPVNIEVMTLRLALEKSQDRKDLEPSLGQKFQLAQTLVDSVLQFHTVSWFQKSISSYNVVFFHERKRSWLDRISDPFFVGYLHSRSKAVDAFTEGPTEDAHHRDYQHPEYRARRSRFRAEYDYYSLGLILLEIGLWKPLDEIFERLKRLYQEDVVTSRQTEQICQSCVPLLRFNMGSRYQNIVATCLRGTFGVSNDQNEEEQHFQVQKQFRTLIVEQLREIKV